MVLHIDLFVDGARHGRVVPWQLECAVLLLETYRGVDADQRLRRSSTLAIAWLLQITGRFELLRSHLGSAINDTRTMPNCWSPRLCSRSRLPHHAWADRQTTAGR